MGAVVDDIMYCIIYVTTIVLYPLMHGLPHRCRVSHLSEHLCFYSSGDEVLRKELEEQVRHWRKESETKERQIVTIKQQRQNELDAVLGEKTVLQADIEQTRRHLKALDHTLFEERRQKDSAVAEKTMMERQNANLQRELSEERREKEVLQQQLTDYSKENVDLTDSVRQLEALLTNAETTIRQRTLKARDSERAVSIPSRESERVLGIPSRDIHLTDKKLGRGSYGGRVTSFCLL